MYDMGMENDENGYKLVVLQYKSDALEGLNRYQEALASLREFDAYKDSLDKVNNKEQLNELNKRFEVNELKMQAEREQMQAERRQLYLVLAIILLAVAGGAFFMYYRYRQAKRMAKIRAEQERIEDELKIARDIQMSMVPSTFPVYDDGAKINIFFETTKKNYQKFNLDYKKI